MARVRDGCCYRILHWTMLCQAVIHTPYRGAEYDYVGEATKSKFLAFMVGWLVILSSIASVSAVALGFGGYLQAITGVPALFFAIALIIAMSAVNFIGIEESVAANIVLTIIEVAGIAIIIILGAEFLGTVDYLETPTGVGGIVSAVGVIFFAFVGFEGLVKIGEETKEPTKTIPRALILSLVISTALYVAAAISVVSVVPYQDLVGSSSALADVAAAAAGPEMGVAMSMIALISTANTVLILSIATSRIAYGMSKRSALPEFLSRVHSRGKTPHFAILTSTVLAILLCTIGNIEFVANVANYTIFIVFLAVDAALLILWRKKAVKGDGLALAVRWA